MTANSFLAIILLFMTLCSVVNSQMTPAERCAAVGFDTTICVDCTNYAQCTSGVLEVTTPCDSNLICDSTNDDKCESPDVVYSAICFCEDEGCFVDPNDPGIYVTCPVINATRETVASPPCDYATEQYDMETCSCQSSVCPSCGFIPADNSNCSATSYYCELFALVPIPFYCEEGMCYDRDECRCVFPIVEVECPTCGKYPDPLFVNQTHYCICAEGIDTFCGVPCTGGTTFNNDTCDCTDGLSTTTRISTVLTTFTSPTPTESSTSNSPTSNESSSSTSTKSSEPSTSTSQKSSESSSSTSQKSTESSSSTSRKPAESSSSTSQKPNESSSSPSPTSTESSSSTSTKSSEPSTSTSQKSSKSSSSISQKSTESSSSTSQKPNESSSSSSPTSTESSSSTSTKSSEPSTSTSQKSSESSSSTSQKSTESSSSTSQKPAESSSSTSQKPNESSSSPSPTSTESSSSTSTKSSEPSTSSSSSVSHDITTISIGSCPICGYAPDSSSCNNFIICSDGNNIPSVCPPNFCFFPDSCACQPYTGCPECGYAGDRFDCNKFYICDSADPTSVLIPSNCPPNFCFDAASCACLPT